MATGVDLIAQERARQVTEEGYDADHDAERGDGSLVLAAVCYALPPERRARMPGVPDSWPPAMYPWEPVSWKPSTRLRDLARAGALIAAEMDRLLAEESDAG